MPWTPGLLYHTTLTVVNYNADHADTSRDVYVLGTHATLEAAKAFAANALHTLGYEPEDFAVFEGHRPGDGTWRHGDGVIVYARAFNGRELIVGLQTTPNQPGFPAGPDKTLHLPHSASGHLHYVLQTATDYNRDRSGAAQTTEIAGCFLHRDDAVRAAKACLVEALGPPEEFAQYDERIDLGPAEDWPFGEDVLVHAVAQTGENYTVAVRTPPDAHKKHGKHTHKHHKHHHTKKEAEKAANGDVGSTNGAAGAAAANAAAATATA